MVRHRIGAAALVGGLAGGALDLLFAVSFAAYNGAPPSRVFEAVASGLIGSSARSGGPAIDALGIACHFALSVGWACLLAGLASRRPKLLRRWLPAAVVFGVAVFLAMRLAVLPLSAYPKPVTFKPMATVLDLLSHIFLFAGPIVALVRRTVRGAGPYDSSTPPPLRGEA